MINIGDTIDNRFIINEKIGSGGMADVFEATDFVAKRVVAVKILKEELASDEENIKLFKNEIFINASLIHPNILEVINEGVYKKCPYIIFEYIKDQTLSDKLEYLTKFTVEESVEIILQLLDALDFMHSHGLVHRDIKPQNIFYLSNGTIKLGDFGIASNESQTSKRIIGSVGYIAPEVIKGMPYSYRSDIYALGIVFFQLITGVLPFDESSTQETINSQLKKKMPLPSKIIVGIPSAVDAIILKATDKNPGERFANANAFKQALLSFKNGTFEKDNFLKRLIDKL